MSGEELAELQTKEAEVDPDILTTVADRSVVNKAEPVKEEVDIETWKKDFETDAKRRAADRKEREKKANVVKDKGNAAFKHGKLEEALARYNEALKIAPHMLVLYSNRAQTYIKLSRFEDAISDCDTVLLYDPPENRKLAVKACVRRSAARLALGQHVDAVADLEKAIKLDHLNKDLPRRLAQLKQDIEQLEQDERLIEEEQLAREDGSSAASSLTAIQAGVQSLRAAVDANRGADVDKMITKMQRMMSNKKNVAFFRVCEGLDVVVSVLKSYVSSQGQALFLLSLVCDEESNANRLGSDEEAVRIVWELAEKGSKDNVRLLGLAVVAQAAESSSRFRIQLAALNPWAALGRTIARNDKSAGGATALMQASAFEIVTSFMKGEEAGPAAHLWADGSVVTATLDAMSSSRSLPLRVKAADTLVSLTALSSKAPSPALLNTCVDTLTAILGDNSFNTEVDSNTTQLLNRTLACINNMAQLPKVPRKLHDQDVLPVLMRLLSAADTRSRAAGVLACLLRYAPAAPDIIAGAPVATLCAMLVGERRGASHAARILAQLAKTSGGSDQIKEHHGFAGLCHVLADQEQDASALANAALCVSDCARVGAYRVFLGELQAVDLLCPLMDHSADAVQTNAAIACARLAAHPPNLERLRELHGIERMYSVMPKAAG